MARPTLLESWLTKQAALDDADHHWVAQTLLKDTRLPRPILNLDDVEEYLIRTRAPHDFMECFGALRRAFEDGV